METVQPSACGFDAARLDHFVSCMQNDIEREQYDGAVVIVARGDESCCTRLLVLPNGQASASCKGTMSFISSLSQRR